MEEKEPEISPSPDGVIRCEGNWTLYHLAGLERRIAALPWPQLAELVWELSGVVAMDPSGAWLLHRTVNELERKGQRVRLQGLSPDLAGLLETAAKNWPGWDVTKPPTRPQWLEQIGRFVWNYGPRAWSGLAFLGENTATALYLFAHPRQIRWRVFLYNLQVDGLNALPITGLLTFLMGVVIAYQGSEQLRTFGANIFIVDLVGISLLREIAPLVTAILVAGRSGSAYTAQIGTMTGHRGDRCAAHPRHLAYEFACVSAGSGVGHCIAFVNRVCRCHWRVRRHADRVGASSVLRLRNSSTALTTRSPCATTSSESARLRPLLSLSPSSAAIKVFRSSGGVDSVGRHTTISVVQANLPGYCFRCFLFRALQLVGCMNAMSNHSSSADYRSPSREDPIWQRRGA